MVWRMLSWRPAVLESAEPVDLSQYVALLSYAGVPKEKPVDASSLHFVWHSTTPRKDGILWPATRISSLVKSNLNECRVIVNGGPRHGSWNRTPDGFEICWNCHGNELKAKRSVFKYLAPTNVLLQVNNTPPWQGILIPVDTHLEEIAQHLDARPINSEPVAAPKKLSKKRSGVQFST